MRDVGDLADALEKAMDGKAERAARKRPATVPATVLGTDADGTVWVSLDGSGRTPVRRSLVECAKGDTVSVTVGGGKAVIGGNESDPPPSSTAVGAVREAAAGSMEQAKRALDWAGQAMGAASSAQSSADKAEKAAVAAEGMAEQAGRDVERIEGYLGDAESLTGDIATLLVKAGDDASAAQASAASASASASGALAGLSTVQDVVGALQWASENCDFSPTGDTAPLPGKWYFSRSGASEPYTYSPAEVAEGDDPAALGLYEMARVNETMRDYTLARLAVTSEGMWVQDPGTDARVLLSAERGVVLMAGGKVVGRYGEGAVIGDEDGAHITIGAEGGEPTIGFWNGTTRVAYVSGQQLYITKTVVVDAMKIGDWEWKAMGNGNLRLRWAVA